MDVGENMDAGTHGRDGVLDLLHVCEIGSALGHIGEVKRIRVLGMIGVVSEHTSGSQSKIDWHVLAIDVNDPLAQVLNSVEDVEDHCPGLMKATSEWFRYVQWTNNVTKGT